MKKQFLAIFGAVLMLGMATSVKAVDWIWDLEYTVGGITVSADLYTTDADSAGDYTITGYSVTRTGTGGGTYDVPNAIDGGKIGPSMLSFSWVEGVIFYDFIAVLTDYVGTYGNEFQNGNDNGSSSFSLTKQDSNGTNIPDGGMTMLLAGMGLTALSLFRRKMK